MEIKKRIYIYIYVCVCVCVCVCDFYLVRENEGEFKATYVILVRRDILGDQQSISYWNKNRKRLKYSTFSQRYGYLYSSRTIFFLKLLWFRQKMGRFKAFKLAKVLKTCYNNFRNNCQWKVMNIYRVSQEEWTKLRESVPYVKIYRYNPKHLYPKLNGYGDNGQRSLKVWQLLHTYWLPNSY